MESLDASRPPIPALLAVGAVHHHLIAGGLRSDTSIVVDTATCYTTHQAAMLIGYGAHAICPYLGYETSRQWRLSARTQSLIKSGKVSGGPQRWGENLLVLGSAVCVCGAACAPAGRRWRDAGRQRVRSTFLR